MQLSGFQNNISRQQAETDFTFKPTGKRMPRRTQIFILIMACQAGLFLPGCSFLNQSGDSPGFTWSAGSEREALPEMIPGETRSIDFQFISAEGVSQVRFEIRNPELKKMGVSLRDEAVLVKEGRASSQAVFKIEKGIRPWSYKLEIIAMDAETEEVIGKGTVPFAVYPYSYINILECSC
jgi:hypothetical protein